MLRVLHASQSPCVLHASSFDTEKSRHTAKITAAKRDKTHGHEENNPTPDDIFIEPAECILYGGREGSVAYRRMRTIPLTWPPAIIRRPPLFIYNFGRQYRIQAAV